MSTGITEHDTVARLAPNEMRVTGPCVVSVILNTNRREDTIECLTSLRGNEYPFHKALVLDNGSTDGSQDAIRARFPEVDVLALQDNLGYAGNNNVGIARALELGADWVFVLNEDTTLAPDCIRHLVEVGESDSHIGIVGPMVYHYNEPGVIQSGGGRLSAGWESSHIAANQEDRGQLAGVHPVDWISGCGILVRREVIEQVGSLDSRYFYFWEETEWCIRAREAGWAIMHVPAAKLWHKGVQRDYRPGPSVTYYATRNRLLTLEKHHAPARVKTLAWLQILRTLTSWTVRPKWRSMHGHRRAMRRGATDFIRNRWGGPVDL